MRMKLVIAFLFVLSAMGIAQPLIAHHSSSSYDMDHQVTLKGTVGNVEWTNPHVFIYLTVKSDNGPEEWRIEGNSPNMLFRVGWKKEMLKAGDQIEVNGAPAKNGAKIMRLVSLTLANGQKFDGQGFK